MDQQFGMLAALLEVWNLVLSTHNGQLTEDLIFFLISLDICLCVCVYEHV